MGKGYHFWGHLEIPLIEELPPSLEGQLFNLPTQVALPDRCDKDAMRSRPQNT